VRGEVNFEISVFLIKILILLAAIFLAFLILIGKLLNTRKLPTDVADAALVFGTGKAWKGRARCAVAADLVRGGFVREVIVSGGVAVKDRGVTEAEWFRSILIDEGVPEECIVLENRATNTKQNVDYALEIIREKGFSSIVLVMSDFEGLRAHLTAAKSWSGHGISIYDWHAPSPGHWSENWWWLSSEGRSLTWYAVSRIYRYSLWRYWKPGEG
jgi:uncharacterized SAM-binding protein YcdF (DUF218 family)